MDVCKDTRTVMKLLKKWIRDYNNVAPHSGLGNDISISFLVKALYIHLLDLEHKCSPLYRG